MILFSEVVRDLKLGYRDVIQGSVTWAEDTETWSGSLVEEQTAEPWIGSACTGSCAWTLGFQLKVLHFGTFGDMQLTSRPRHWWQAWRVIAYICLLSSLDVVLSGLRWFHMHHDGILVYTGMVDDITLPTGVIATTVVSVRILWCLQNNGIV